MRTTCVSPTTKMNRNRTRGVTRFLLGRNSSSVMLGGKTAGETRTNTGGDKGREGETDGK